LLFSVNSLNIAVIMSLDPTDAAILYQLQADARTPTATLARRMGLARSTVQARIEKLETSGAIAGYTIRRGDQRQALRAYVMLGIAPQAQAVVEAALKRIEGVETLLSVSGPYDLIAIAAAATPEALDVTLDCIRATEGVRDTLSSIMLSRKFDRS
jgi:DNA-binding Lrp family transcriptional regulator